MSHPKFAQKLNVIIAVSVLILCGTVCSSFPINCTELWDEETIAEMIEDYKHYEEKLKSRQERELEEEHEDDHGEEHEDDREEEHEDDYGEEREDDHGEEDEDDHGEEYEDDRGEEDEDDHGEEDEDDRGEERKDDHGEEYEDDRGEEHVDDDGEERPKRQITLTAGKQRPASASVEEDPAADLEVAETHIFRPLFRYKSQYTERRRVRDNFTPSRQ